MQRTIGRFLRALRASEIPISPAEAIDAHTTVDMEIGRASCRERVWLKV
jgi:uncharacterized protein with von Willebrand factor type A (vWA) domain